MKVFVNFFPHLFLLNLVYGIQLSFLVEHYSSWLQLLFLLVRGHAGGLHAVHVFGEQFFVCNFSRACFSCFIISDWFLLCNLLFVWILLLMEWLRCVVSRWHASVPVWHLVCPLNNSSLYTLVHSYIHQHLVCSVLFSSDGRFPKNVKTYITEELNILVMYVFTFLRKCPSEENKTEQNFCFFPVHWIFCIHTHVSNGWIFSPVHMSQFASPGNRMPQLV